MVKATLAMPIPPCAVGSVAPSAAMVTSLSRTVSFVSPSSVIGSIVSMGLICTWSPTMSIDIEPGGSGLSLSCGSIAPTGKL